MTGFFFWAEIFNKVSLFYIACSEWITFSDNVILIFKSWLELTWSVVLFRPSSLTAHPVWMREKVKKLFHSEHYSTYKEEVCKVSNHKSNYNLRYICWKIGHFFGQILTHFGHISWRHRYFFCKFHFSLSFDDIQLCAKAF